MSAPHMPDVRPPRLREVLALACLAVSTAAAQGDSGWTPIFNGRNFDGLYIRSGRAELRDPAKQNYARVEPDGSLYLPNPGPAGAICTKANLSYYHARIQYHFPSADGTPNAGMLYHVDSLDWLPTDDYGSSTVDRVPSLQPSCGGSWFPKGWEAQMRRGQTGAIYGVANVWGETTARNGRWDPQGEPRSIVPSKSSGPKNLNPSQGDWPDGPSDWVTLEILVYGADSVIHVVNGTRVFKMTRLRHNRIMVPCEGGGTWNTGPQLPLTNGKHCVQIEGARMTYRNWEMRPLSKAGGPTGLGERGEGRADRPGQASGVHLRVDSRPGRRQVGFEFSGSGADAGASAPAGKAGSLEIRTLRGGLVRDFRIGSGSGSLAWDLNDAAGKPVDKGLYIVRFASGRSLAARAFFVH